MQRQLNNHLKLPIQFLDTLVTPKCGPQTRSINITWDFVRMQIHGPHSRLTESEILKVGPSNFFRKPSECFWWMLMFENHSLKTVLPNLFTSWHSQKVTVFVQWPMLRGWSWWRPGATSPGLQLPQTLYSNTGLSTSVLPFHSPPAETDLKKLIPVLKEIRMNVHCGVVSHNEKPGLTWIPMSREGWINHGMFLHWDAIHS